MYRINKSIKTMSRDADGQVYARHFRRCSAAAAAFVISAAVIDSASAASFQGSGSVIIDPVAIGNAIAGAVHANSNQEGCIDAVVNTVDYQTGNKYNVLAVNASQHPNFYDNSIVYFTTTVCNGVAYDVWAFKSGEFTHQGDGGWINWEMSGSFTRDGDGGKHVVFYPR
jgi:hypothetical protein